MTKSRDDLPPLFRRHVRRPRLTRILDETNAQSILIIGPAGYGKTTLVAEWLQGRDDGVWYRATPASADVAAFSAGVVDVIQPIVPGAGERVKQRLRVPDAPDDLPRVLAELLAEDIEEWPQDKWVVVDDYHLVMDSNAVEQFVDWLLTLSNIRLVVTTRRSPGWLSARRVLYGDTAQITADDLAMTADEVETALADMPPEAITNVLRRAEGWPVIIGLAPASVTGPFDPRGASETLFNYFAEEVLRNEPEDVQNAMLALSVLPYIDDPSAAAVLGEERAAHFTARLREQGILHSTGVMVHAIHPLLKAFLYRRLSASSPALKRDAERRAIEHLRSLEKWEEAFDLAASNGNLQDAAEIAGEAASTLLAEGRLETLEKWLTLCGPSTLVTPSAELARADLLLRRDHADEAAAVATQLAESLSDTHPSKPRAAATSAQARYWLAEHAEALRLSALALRIASEPEDVRKALWTAYLASEVTDDPKAIHYLDQLESAVGDDIDYKMRLAVGRVLHNYRQGTNAGAWATLQRLLPFLDWSVDPMASSNFLVYCAHTQTALAEYDRAADYAAQAMDLCETLRLTFAIPTCLMHRFDAEVGRRNFGLAGKLLRDLSNIAARSPEAYALWIAARCELRWMLARRESKALPHEAPASWRSLGEAFLGEWHALMALALAATGDHEHAGLAIHTASRLSRTPDAYFVAQFASAVSEDAAGNAAGARSRVESLLTEASDAHYFDGFVLAFRSSPRLLMLAAETSQSHLALEIAARTRDNKLVAQLGLVPASRYREGVLEQILTRREIEVLDLMSRGLQNSAIARRLFISPSTVKVHSHNIRRKLGVRTRLEAVTRYRELAAGD